jgi:hypothetical protein
VIGIDRDPAQVAFAAQRAEAAGLTNVRFVAGDFRDTESPRRWTRSSAGSCSCMRRIRSTHCAERCAICGRAG